ncbi:MAG: hypothetical protein QOD86_1950 [Miltoncostaeaceae bacterium]|jgi:hypothetical protein|nr:hypothetical protein [Miltoncostaeaceae bacterium]
MPGGRPIHGADVHAAMAHAARPGADAVALRAAVRDDDAFLTLEELAAACPPERIGLAPGAYAALFGPLFGEFE